MIPTPLTLLDVGAANPVEMGGRSVLLTATTTTMVGRYAAFGNRSDRSRSPAIGGLTVTTGLVPGPTGSVLVTAVLLKHTKDDSQRREDDLKERNNKHDTARRNSIGQARK